MSRQGVTSDFDSAGHHGEFLRLIEEAKGGCDQAMGRLIAECRPYLLAIANVEITGELAAKVGASDVVQNSMLSAQRCIGQFNGHNREELLAWLRGILIKDLQQTRRHYHAARRNVGREQPLRGDSVDAKQVAVGNGIDSPSAVAADREDEERLYRSLQRLSDDERLVIELRNWQRLPFAEIGERMERSSEAARKLWSRAILRLQRELGADDA